MSTEIKYRPRNLDEIVYPDKNVKEVVEMYASGYGVKPLILHGPNGTGKSLLAELIPKAIDGRDVKVDKVFADDLRNRASVQKALKRTALFDDLMTVEGQSNNYTILDECILDGSVHRDSLQYVMDEMLGRSLIIVTTNHLNQFLPGVLSRSFELYVPPLKPDAFLPRAKYILNSEGIETDEAALLNLLVRKYEIKPDNRRYFEALDMLIYKSKYQ
jgi:DNA polymerase III delta prime subunit